MKLILLLIAFLLMLSSCGPLKVVHVELYKTALTRQCLTDTECEGIEARIYEMYYSCNATMRN